MYLLFTRMPCDSYRGRLRCLLLFLCDVFWALINSLLCWSSSCKFPKPDSPLPQSFKVSKLQFGMWLEPLAFRDWLQNCCVAPKHRPVTLPESHSELKLHHWSGSKSWPQKRVGEVEVEEKKKTQKKKMGTQEKTKRMRRDRRNRTRRKIRKIWEEQEGEGGMCSKITVLLPIDCTTLLTRAHFNL